MSNTRYIEIYSAHRNRNRYPHPSYFEIPFSPTKQLLNGSQALDPLIKGAIYYTFTSKFIVDQGFTKNGSRDSAPLLEISGTHSQSSLPNYYLGFNMAIEISSLNSQIRSIINYNPPSVAITPNVSYNGVTSGQPYVIFDMSTRDFIHLPATDVYDNHLIEYDQAYNGYYVMDETLSYGRTIIARLIKYYDQTTRYAYYDEPMPIGWNVNDSYTIRKSLPVEKWTLSTPTTINNDPLIGQVGLIVITLPSGASSEDDYYVGKYIYFATNIPYSEYNLLQSVFKPIYGNYYITKYIGSTRQALCYYDLNDTVSNRSYPTFPSINPVVNPPGTLPQNLKGDTINIVNFTQDNYSPMNYNGSIVSQNQTVCYDISLVNLTLPNVVLTTGSRIAFYPFVYVELQNSTAPSGASQDIIYSNNPESGRALFIAAVTDVVQPILSSFVKLDGGAMAQTIKFKPNDSMKFAVYLPDGTPFLPVDEDILSPYTPNSLLQINAVFSIRRL